MNVKKLIIGILAHVDAGKTTLSESILYLTGHIRNLGRVDHQNTFLDTFELERARGITIFAKQAGFLLGDTEVTLLDTPGHVDFSAEMERTLQVLDYAVLVINGADGVQSHTITLWKLLKCYQIPVFLFINKMDQTGTERNLILRELSRRLDDGCIDFDENQNQDYFFENLSLCDEELLDQYLAQGKLDQDHISAAIKERKVYPCYFGSALKLEGVDRLLQGLEQFTMQAEYLSAFGAKVFKISRDKSGNRLTHMKITGGMLKVKDLLTNGDGAQSLELKEIWSEKADQIRIYSGEKYTTPSVVFAGTICTVTGLSRTYAGQGLGAEAASEKPLLEPVLSYQILLPEECNVHEMFLKFRQLEEEEPQLNLRWNEQSGEIYAKVMGEVEVEILKSMITERFGVQVGFGQGSIVYKETILGTVEGVGHFEPLRHYAEVHLLMEPGERGSGLQFDSDCSEDLLGRNWQRLVLTHLKEKKHLGVLTGSEITDIRITLITGRAHNKHTEGGDFRQATYRAVRQGLKKAQSVLLEPVYKYSLEIPAEMVGRALSDIQKMYGTFSVPEIIGDQSMIHGVAPVSTMRNYQMEVNAYSRGQGKLFCLLNGYQPCHNAEQVIKDMGYDSEIDAENPTGSVFCSHGAGFIVSWDQVEDYMHLDSGLQSSGKVMEKLSDQKEIPTARKSVPYVNEKELEEIFVRTYGPVKREKKRFSRDTGSPTLAGTTTVYKTLENHEKYLLVDGYNIIFAWTELKELAKVRIDSARSKLMDILCNYQAYKQVTLILVFDAYKVEGNPGSVEKYHNINVVYTKEAETADQYIEKVVHKIGRKYDVTVATSDAVEQIIIWGSGAKRLSAAALKEEIESTNEEIRMNHLTQSQGNKNFPFAEVSLEE